MSFYALSALINGLTSLILAILVFLKNRKLTVNKTFILFCLSAAAWSMPYFFWQISKDVQSALFWSRALIGGAIFIPVFYLHFVIAFLERIERNKKLLFAVYAFAIISLIIDFTPYFVKNVEPALSFPFWPKPGILFHFFLVAWFLIIIYTTYLLIKKYRTATGVLRDQIRYILIGMIIGYIGGSTNYFLWYGIPIKPYGNILASVYVGTTAYAIIRHRLMDIKLVARRSTVYLASVLTIFLPAIPVLYLIDRYYPEFLISGSLAMIVVAVSIFSPIRDYFYRLANRYFFSSLYDSREVISSLTDKLRSTLEAGRIYFFIAQTLKNAFHSKAIGLLTFNEKEGTYTVQYNDGFLINGQKIFRGDEALERLFIKKGITVIVEEIKKDYYKDHKEIFDLFARLGIEIVTPLNVKDKTVGLIILGAKESRDMYNSEDLRVLEIAGAQAAISIENALLYEETKNFAITLKYEVEKATSDLRAANEQLKKLDQAKSDFISMVSHQLRTPLTAIKGFTSMVMEGSYGPVGSRASDQLGKVSESAERLIRLVNDLLDVSHMEGGKMEFNFAKVDFGAMVAGVVEELQPQAQKGGLNLEFLLEKSDRFFVRADEQKLRQVVINLVDNAVKYTRQGSVRVGLEKKDGFVQLFVKDTGVGMDKETIDNLFKKFVRGAGASHYHTEGAGVGLYVAKQLIEAHKGQIWAESEGEGKGSEFFVKLPEWKG